MVSVVGFGGLGLGEVKFWPEVRPPQPGSDRYLPQLRVLMRLASLKCGWFFKVRERCRVRAFLG